MSQHILIVDDEDLTRQMLREAFEQAGHRVSDTAQPTREHVKSEDRVHFILMDVNMPMMDGDDLAAFFKREWAVKAPIYLMSSIPEEELKQKAEGREAIAGYVCKSWGPEKIVEIAERAMELHPVPTED